ncbi:MAG: hypothetical protein ACJ788_22835 [Ktedonobacteraceae bacterium]
MTFLNQLLIFLQIPYVQLSIYIPPALIMLDWLTGVLSSWSNGTFDVKRWSDFLNRDGNKFLVSFSSVLASWLTGNTNPAITFGTILGSLVILAPSTTASIIENLTEIFHWTPEQRAAAQTIGNDVDAFLTHQPQFAPGYNQQAANQIPSLPPIQPPPLAPSQYVQPSYPSQQAQAMANQAFNPNANSMFGVPPLNFPPGGTAIQNSGQWVDTPTNQMPVAPAAAAPAVPQQLPAAPANFALPATGTVAQDQQTWVSPLQQAQQVNPQPPQS